MSDQQFRPADRDDDLRPRAAQRLGHAASINWEFSAGVQHELMPRVSVDAGYFRRDLRQLHRHRQPAGGAERLQPVQHHRAGRIRGCRAAAATLITGLYDLNPNRVGQVNNFSTFASNYGEQIEHWNGVDVIVNVARARRPAAAGRVSTGRTTTDSCDIVTKIDNPSPLYCHVDTAFLTQVKFLGSYLVPRVDVQISGSSRAFPVPRSPRPTTRRTG